jgi:small conductance mechanosensitive channel
MEDLPFEWTGSFTTFGLDLLSKGMALGWNGLTALILFVVGLLFARMAARLVRNAMTRARADPTLTGFFSNLLYYGLLTMVGLAALSNLGVETTQFIAVIGAAGLAVGLALEGALSNFAAGVLIIVFRPFKVGDYIEAADSAGFVEEIEMVVTVLRTLGNEIVIIPNSAITGAKIKNLSSRPHVNLDIVLPISHDADLDTVLRILEKGPDGNPDVLTQPAPQISVVSMDRDGVLVQLTVAIPGGKHDEVKAAILEKVKRAFDAAGIVPLRKRA